MQGVRIPDIDGRFNGTFAVVTEVGHPVSAAGIYRLRHRVYNGRNAGVGVAWAAVCSAEKAALTSLSSLANGYFCQDLFSNGTGIKSKTRNREHAQSAVSKNDLITGEAGRRHQNHLNGGTQRLTGGNL
jgi:hypothetical protein